VCLQGSIDDIHVVCGCLKDFLRSLKESLITYSLWNDFVSATGRWSHYHNLRLDILHIIDDFYGVK